MPTIAMQWCREVNWPLLRAGFPFMREMTLQLSDASVDVLELAASVVCRNIVLGHWRQRVEPQRRLEVSFRDLQFDWDFGTCLPFVDNTEPALAELQLNVRLGTREQARVYSLPSLPVHVLSPKLVDGTMGVNGQGEARSVPEYPYYQWRASLDEPDARSTPDVDKGKLTTEQQHLVISSLAALCLPEHAAILRLCRDTEAAIRLVRAGASGAPINLQQSAAGRRLLFEALYSQLSQRQLTYVREDIAFRPGRAYWTQRVRLPDELEQNPIGRLTCLDWALIAAAACEQWAIDPLILVGRHDGTFHAVTAIRTVPPGQVGTRRPAIFPYSRQAARSLLAFDFTVCSDVEEAEAAASEFLAAADFCIAIDIPAARAAGCSPLPLGKPHDAFRERYRTLIASDLRWYVSQISPEELFIPLQGDLLTPSAASSLENILEFLVQSPHVKTAILANSGAGKSYLLAKFFLKKLKTYCTDLDSPSIPIFFPLRSFDPLIPVEVQLYRHLQQRGYTRTEPEFYQALEQGHVACYLDALDEMRLGGGAEVEQLLEKLNPLLTLPNLELVLTARLGLFGAKALSLLPHFNVLLLRQWDDTHWHAFLDGYATLPAQALPEAVKPLQEVEVQALKNLQGPVRSLITKPLYCQMIVEERDHVLQYGIQNEAELFRIYINKFWERREHAFLTARQKNVCMRDIAYKMEHSDRVWTITRLADEINRKYGDLADVEAWTRYLKDIRVYSFLDTAVSVGQEDEFSFSHEAFREFFLAEYLVEKLTTLVAKCQVPVEELTADDRKERTDALQTLAATKISLEVARMIGDLLKLAPDYTPEILASAMKLPAATKTHRARNLALVEIVMSGRCPEWKLEGADFSTLSLVGTDFTGCQLDRAQFLNCDLQGCCFDRAHLNKAKFDDSNIAGASFQGSKGTPSYVNCQRGDSYA